MGDSWGGVSKVEGPQPEARPSESGVLGRGSGGALSIWRPRNFEKQSCGQVCRGTVSDCQWSIPGFLRHPVVSK